MRMFLALVLGMLMVASAPQAQSFSNSSYRGGTNFDFGVLPGFSGGFQSGGVENILEVGVSLGGGADFLGCAGVDLFSFAETTFNFNFNVDRFVSNLKTKVAKWAITQMMTHPQLAAVFDTLNQMENFRWDMFNESCNINEIRADAKAKFVDYCVANSGGGPQAYANCAGQYDSESTGLLTEAADKFLNFQKSFPTMSSVLPGTTFCDPQNKENHGTAICTLEAFIPQMRFCHTTNRRRQSDEDPNRRVSASLGCESIGEIEIGDTFLGFPQLLETSNYAIETQVYATMGASIEDMLAQGQSLDSLAIASRRMEAIGMPDPDPVDDLGGIVQDYLQHTACTYYNPYAVQNHFAAVVEGTEALSPGSGLNGFDEFKTELRAVFDEQGVMEGLIAMGAENADAAQELIAVGIGCVTNEDVHISPADHIRLQAYPRAMRDGYYAAAANEAASVFVHKLIGFTRTRLEEARAQIGTDREHYVRYPSGTAGEPCPNGEPPLNPEQEAAMDPNDLPPLCEEMEYEMPGYIEDGMQMLLVTLEEQQERLNLQRRIRGTIQGYREALGL